MITRIFFTASLLCFGTLLTSIAQVCEYKVFWGDQEIGAIKANRVLSNGKETITIDSDVRFQFAGEHVHSSFLEAQFSENHLTNSHSESSFNEKLKEKSIIKTSGGKYTCEMLSASDHCITEKVKYSVAKLWYYEPVDESRIFSETYIDYATLSKLGTHSYLLTLPDGKTNIYTYEEGNLKEVKVNRPAFTLIFKRM